MNYIVTEYTPEGYANNKEYATEAEARAELTARAARYNARPITNSIYMTAWQASRGDKVRTLAEVTVPRNATVDEYLAYIDTLSN